MTQRLVARIKKSSKYATQAPPTPGGWFDVCVVADDEYRLRGNFNSYRWSDVVLGVRIADDKVIPINK